MHSYALQSASITVFETLTKSWDVELWTQVYSYMYVWVFWANLFCKLVGGEGQDAETLGLGKPPMQLDQLSVVLLSQPSLGGYVHYQGHMTSVGKDT